MKVRVIRIPSKAIPKLFELKSKMTTTLLKRIFDQPTSLSTPDLTPVSTTDLVPNLTPDSASDFTPNPSKRRGHKYQPPHSPASDLWRNRLHDIFPRGLENAASTNTSKKIGQSFTYAAQQLYDLFDRRIDDPHAQSTVVKSAWYGKQVRAAQHEFIVLHVEDLKIPGLRNCMVIDRNQPGKDAATAFSSPIATDTFRVAYDGDLNRLLQESCLTPHLELEEISFLSDKPLFLHELVILVNHISEGHRRYIPMDTNCYWFSGLIWECLRKMHPTAEHRAFTPAGRKGKFGFVRTIPNPIQVRNVLREIANDPLGLNESETELEEPFPTPSPTPVEPSTRRGVTV